MGGLWLDCSSTCRIELLHVLPYCTHCYVRYVNFLIAHFRSICIIATNCVFDSPSVTSNELQGLLKQANFLPVIVREALFGWFTHVISWFWYFRLVKSWSMQRFAKNFVVISLNGLLKQVTAPWTFTKCPFTTLWRVQSQRISRGKPHTPIFIHFARNLAHLRNYVS